ncbi:MAG: hypothetical protein JWL76_236 [Thermoleophilia bacterium]|nr:hypothetical protein [Thermoleophilia bacterium]
MTMIDVDTSPLQAAREWRGIGLVAAAMNCGLPVAQAEALETGDPAAFSTIDEMIAAAVVYGSSIGIGRDEAMALLDRTVCRTGAQVHLPDTEPANVARPHETFSETVHERSARIADRSDVAITPPLLTTALTGQEMVAHPVLDPIIDEPSVPSIELPAIPHGPTPEQAVAASGELHLDGAFGPDAPWERTGETGELEAWVDDFDDYDAPAGAVAHERHGANAGSRIGGASFAALERVVGTDRADAFADRTRELTSRVSEVARTGRERLRRSEHATLFVAIGAGAILIAIVVALGGALGGSDTKTGPGPADRTSAKDVTATDAAAKATPKADAKATPAVKPIIPPARLTLDIFNAGSKKGYAKEVAAQLDAAGYKIGEVTNSKSSYTGATIIHPADMVREARLLARKTGISTLQVAPGSTRKITIVVT